MALMQRPCIERGCPNLTPRTRCPAHERERDARRGSSTQRGYGAEHQRARERLRATLPAPCGYGCGVILWPNGRWVAAHVVDGNPDAGWIASCLRCNERAKRTG